MFFSKLTANNLVPRLNVSSLLPVEPDVLFLVIEQLASSQSDAE